MDKFKTIAIEANIGAGKTKLLEYISKLVDAEILHEPIGEWTYEGKDLLTNFYQNPREWGYTLQLKVTETLAKRQMAPPQKQIRIMETNAQNF